MSLTDPLHVLDTRRSVPSKQLGEPGPDHATLLRMLASAVRVPDHGKLVPFRFIRLQGEARHALGDLLAARTLHLQPDAADAVVEKDRARFSHAPVIVTVVARLTPGHKVPEQEQLLTAGSVCFALLQAAQALGFGAQWLTGWMAYDDAVAATLGLSADERIAGFIHIGTPKMEAPERERPDPALLLTDWTPGA
ncbi:nitroreductase family protein [Pseudoxanthomonas mexicana]|uniref:nitroreductase family protein n=1 Tax=Pseudoxanthomonas mexicana TaxID=128785 RepID=UPI001B41071A|nr:nitroreductase [Pseudoxanthomonas mexicana]MBP7597621.1 nitroreductase [Pseudoxanthomonas sp.]MBP7655252.1 nitroreductase [Pseudoxanthomonas sp.]UOV00901.1 nitroreductase [Pseudoxanthomonas mexicana]WBX93987.1 nitroreductase [Pseudoxanthomonas mexicana]